MKHKATEHCKTAGKRTAHSWALSGRALSACTDEAKQKTKAGIRMQWQQQNFPLAYWLLVVAAHGLRRRHEQRINVDSHCALSWNQNHEIVACGYVGWPH